MWEHDGDIGRKLSNFMSMVEELLQLLRRKCYNYNNCTSTVQVWKSKKKGLRL